MSDFSRRDFIKKSILLSLGASYIISCEDNDMLGIDTESDSSDCLVLFEPGILGLHPRKNK